MAKGKKSKSKGFMSKGLRPNVSKKTRIAVRKTKEANNPFFGMEGRHKIDAEINRKLLKGQSLTRSEKLIYEKSQIKDAAEKLYSKWFSVAAYSACVQAVKTDYVPQFEAKCHDANAKGVYRV